MGRKTKKGLDYSPWDTAIFENDTKIDELIDAQGWIGFSVYFYLCQKAYASDGYFYRWSYANAATTARRMGGGIGSETVKQTVAVCLRIGLFDKRLYDLGVLSSKGIQRRYLAAVGRRKADPSEQAYWLLDGENDDSDISADINVISADINRENDDRNDPKIKVNEIKLNETKGNGDARASEACGRIVSFYENGAGTVASPYFGEVLPHFVGVLGEDVVKHGIEAAFLEGKTTPRYILAILRRYEQEKLTTLEDVLRSERKFELERAGNKGRGNRGSGGRALKPEEYSPGFLEEEEGVKPK